MKIHIDELRERIGEALTHWEFENCTRYGAEQRAALVRAYQHPEMLCDDGIYEISGRDIWDSLSIYAEATGANIAAVKQEDR